jgi:hypothetical protein
MRVGEVQAKVEGILDMPVSRDTVNSCLSTGARRSSGRFIRLGPGLYQVRGKRLP